MKKISGFVKQLLITLLMIVAFSLPAGAEFYKYVDENGNTVYTDDLSAVPADQRAHIQKYEESTSTPAVEPAAETQSGNASQAASAVDPEAERQMLVDKKNKLDAEYEALMEEREKLEKEKEAATTNAEIKAYNEKVSSFNEKIKDFDERRKAFETEIASYNKMINSAAGAKSDTGEAPSN